MINSLIRIPYSSTLQYSTVPIEFRHVIEGDVLLVLKKRRLSLEDMDHVDHNGFSSGLSDNLIAATISLIASSDMGSGTYSRTYNEIEQSVSINGFVDGYEVLNLSTAEKLWISILDLEYIKSNYEVVL